tara:strand:+ start:96 stop:488 length:393 start_codon:yes stop_codon:yes gene_type:complete
MGKKATIGTSPKDSSMDKMDRYIRRNEAREEAQLRRHGKIFGKKKSVDEMSIHDQIRYYEKMTPEQKFDNKYSTYSIWYEAVKKKMEEFVYTSYFIDEANKIKPEMKGMFESRMSIKEAVNTLKTVYKIY